jgi:hypothetical protein
MLLPTLLAGFAAFSLTGAQTVNLDPSIFYNVVGVSGCSEPKS